jgi:cell wall assembly regulator SMI1
MSRVAALYAEIRRLWEQAAGPGSFRMRPPAAAAAMSSWERATGRPLPGDLCALYGLADGEEGYVGLLFNHGLLPAEQAAREYLRASDPLPEAGEDEVILDVDPPDTIRRVLWSPGWVPFASDGGGNFLAVDLDPAPAGRAGQVIVVGRDFMGEP